VTEASAPLPKSGESPPGFLAGLRILELGDGIAGAAGTSLLRSLGAEVTAVIDPASLHRHGRPDLGRGGGGDGSASLLSVILDRGKRIVPITGLELSDVESLAAGFDLVVFDRVATLRGPLDQLHDISAYSDAVARFNTAAWLTISAFGLTGERRDEVATELTVAAASGMLASVRDPLTGRPLKLAGYQSLLNTAQAAALAACQAVDLARDGVPVHLDLSAVEATVAMGPTLEMAAVLLNAGGPGGAKRYGAPASFYPCRDGLVRISAMEDHQWQGVVTSMGSPEWADAFAATEARIAHPDVIDRHIQEWTRTLDKQDAETLLQSHGVPATAMYSPAESLRSAQLDHRNAFATVPLADGRSVRVIDVPYRRLGSESDAVEGRRLRSLRGLKVVEVGHVLAAPLAGALLGAMGADVQKLEDLKRIDMYRRRGPYIDETAGSERSAYFALVNHSKRSVAFDVEATPERLAALLDEADVVVENLGGRRAARLGLAASELLKHQPDVLAISSSGFGQDGPFASYRAYAYNLQATCCLGYLTRNADSEYAEIDLPWADLVTGFAIATVIAAWAVGPQGNAGTGLDFAMADLIVSHFNEFIAAACLDQDSDTHVDRANEMYPYSPNGVYATSDGWIAISVAGDDQYAALVGTLDHEPLRDPQFSSPERRFTARRTLDELVEQATRDREGAVLAEQLRSAGIAAEPLVGARELPTFAPLVEREFFAPVDHPDWGLRRLVGLPWREFGKGPIVLAAPPILEPEGS
jgi:crotonobetainyl-CoA:carnitine CoA-transferase CaiB-like acyl-CoA transferase